MPFSAILLGFKFLMFSFLQVCKFTDLQVHNSIDCPYFYGLSVKISDLLHLSNTHPKHMILWRLMIIKVERLFFFCETL